VQNIWG